MTRPRAPRRLGAMLRLDLAVALAVGVALSLAPSAGAAAQGRTPAWWVGVFPVDGSTVLTLTAETGREVRSGARPGEIRHGLEVPLAIDASGERVEMTVAATPDRATRWTLTRAGDEIVVEEWLRRGAEGTAWERVRAVRVPLPRGTADP